MILRNRLAVFALGAALALTIPALAQTASAPPKTSAGRSSQNSMAAKFESVASFTRRKWNEARREFAREKTQWSGCRRQSREHHLAGRKSWSFLYDCMTRRGS